MPPDPPAQRQRVYRLQLYNRIQDQQPQSGETPRLLRQLLLYLIIIWRDHAVLL